MTEEEVARAFNSYAKGKGIDASDLSLSDFPRLLIDYYLEVKFRGLDQTDDGDLVLFQYGTHDWGDGRFYEVDFTRQFYNISSNTGDHEIFQQRFTFYFEPEPVYIAPLNVWSNDSETLSAFENLILRSEGYRAGLQQRLIKFETSIEVVC